MAPNAETAKRKPPQDWPQGVATTLDELAHLRSAGERLARQSSFTRVGTLLAGAHRSQFRGRGIEFAEVREYHPGDDPRTIDWRVTARTGQVHTKLFHEERERPVLFLPDFGGTMSFGTRRCFKSVQAARISALLGFAALSGGDRVGGCVLSRHGLTPFRAIRSRRRWLAMLDRMAEASQEGAAEGLAEDPALAPLDIAMRRLLSFTSPGCQVIILSDFYRLGDDFETSFRLLARRTDLQLLHISDPLEWEAPPKGVYLVSNGKQLAEIDAGERHLRAGWRRPIEQRSSYLRELCTAHEATYLSLSTALPEADQLMGQSRPGEKK